MEEPVRKKPPAGITQIGIGGGGEGGGGQREHRGGS